MKFGRVEVALFGALVLLLCVVPFSLAQAPSEPISEAPVYTTPVPQQETYPDSHCAKDITKPTEGTNWSCTRLVDNYSATWVHNGSLTLAGDFIMPYTPGDTSWSGYQLIVLGNITIGGSIIYYNDMATVLISYGCASVGSVNIDWSNIVVPRSYANSDGGAYDIDILRQKTVNTSCPIPQPMSSTSFKFTPATKWCRSYSPIFHNTPRYNGDTTYLSVDMVYNTRCANLATLFFLLGAMAIAVIISLIVYFCHTRPQNKKLEFNRM